MSKTSQTKAKLDLILNTPICRIVSTQVNYVLQARLQTGQWVSCMPYSKDPRGLTSALILATDFVSGKIMLSSVEGDGSFMERLDFQSEQLIFEGGEE